MTAATRMMSDLLRAACVIAVMTIAAALVVEMRLRLASIDLAHRAAIAAQQTAAPAVHGFAPAVRQPPAGEPRGRLGQLGAASLALGEAVLGVIR